MCDRLKGAAAAVVVVEAGCIDTISEAMRSLWSGGVSSEVLLLNCARLVVRMAVGGFPPRTTGDKEVQRAGGNEASRPRR